MGIKASEVIKLAQSYIGAKTGSTTHKSIVDTYNTQSPLPRGYKVSYTDSWCATFITALFVKLNALDLIYGECSCQKMIEGLKNKGLYIENENRTPSVGDLVFYDWQDGTTYASSDNTGWADHVGIVESVSGTNFVVIEGNNGGAVARRTVAVNGRYLRGFASPKYDTESVSTSTTVSNQKTLKNGDVIKLKSGATYWNGKAIPSWVFSKTLYYRGTNSHGIIFSTLKSGAVTGVVTADNITY